MERLMGTMPGRYPMMDNSFVQNSWQTSSVIFSDEFVLGSLHANSEVRYINANIVHVADTK